MRRVFVELTQKSTHLKTERISNRRSAELIQQHRRERTDLGETYARVGGAGDGVEVVDVQARDAAAAHTRRRQRRGARGAKSVAAPIGIHPDARDLPDRRLLRSAPGLEDHLAALEAGPRPARGDQPRDPSPVATPAVADSRIDSDLAAEHIDGPHQVRVELVDTYRPHGRGD